MTSDETMEVTEPESRYKYLWIFDAGGIKDNNMKEMGINVYLM